MRGKADLYRLSGLAAGITPAYAGKSPSVPPDPLTIRDHPRLCGEKKIPAASPPFITGSPPPMRGKAQYSYIGDAVDGITPAYAGKSHALLCSCTSSLGSPPPMRGKGVLHR